MNKKICISIGDVGFIECMQLVTASPLVELRLDLMRLGLEQIEILAMRCRQWVATCRPGKYTERERTILLSAAIRAGATYVDIEYEAEAAYRQALVKLAQRMGSQVIISYHNFENTPDAAALDAIIGHARNMAADWVKLAVTTRSATDAANILSLYQRHDRLIAFGMGEVGAITRVAAPYLGAPFTFAAMDAARATASGQLTAAQLEVIFQTIGNNYENI
jgi:3-dehydroquinate dehydratase type I